LENECSGDMTTTIYGGRFFFIWALLQTPSTERRAKAKSTEIKKQTAKSKSTSSQANEQQGSRQAGSMHFS